MTVIVNTSPLVALDRIGCLAILPRLLGQVIRPQSVVDELRAGHDLHGGSKELYQAEWCQTVEDPPEMILRKELGAGETAVIALAAKISADLVVLDDLAARNVATELGLNITGTLGILLAAHKQGIFPNLDDALNSLKQVGFRVSDRVLQSIKSKSNNH